VKKQTQMTANSGIYQACTALIARATGGLPPVAINSPEALACCCASHPALLAELPYLKDLGRVEEYFSKLRSAPVQAHQAQSAIRVNPDLRLLDDAFSGLPRLLTGNTHRPQPRQGFVLLYRLPESDRIEIEDAHPHDLLAIKIIAENLEYRQLASEHGVTRGHIDDIVYQAAEKGILIRPPSRIRRPDRFMTREINDEQFIFSPVFTQQCDLSCRHC
jgi:hypothetical protein